MPVKLREVTGTFRNLDGSPVIGGVAFTLFFQGVDPVNRSTIIPGTLTVPLEDGHFSVNLPVYSTVIPDIARTIMFTEPVSGKMKFIVVPYGEGPIDIMDIEDICLVTPEAMGVALTGLKIGTVSKLSAGATPTVTVTGGAPAPTLNFGIPVGDTAEPAVGVGVRAALAERAERRVRVVSIGDSHTEPVGASSHFNGWVALVARELGGDGGSTIHITPDTTAAVSSTAVEWNAVNHHAAELIWGHSEVTWNGLDDVDAVGVVYLHVGSEESPEYTRPLVSINGGAASDAYSSTDVLYTPATSYRVGWVAGWSGSGSLTVRTPEPAKALVFGILARRDSGSSGWDTGTGRGVEWVNWGRSGWSSRDWATNLDEWVIAEPIRALPPDVLHIGLGANDAVQGVPASEIEANVAGIIAHVRGYAPDVPVIATLSPWCDVHTSVTEAAWSSSVEAVAAAVTDAGGSVIDLRQIGPESAHRGLWLPGENHWSPSGHRLVADLVGRALTSGTPA